MTCPETRQINGPRLAAPGASLKQAFPAGLRGLPGPVAAVAHGGVTAELLRNLLGDDALPPGVLAAGIPPYAITTVDDLNPVMIASVSHLRERRSTASHLSAAEADIQSKVGNA